MKLFSKSVNIILVDDDHEDSMYFEEALKEVNPKAKCSCFYSGSDAFQFLTLGETIIPDILFLDLNMPGMTGKAFLRKVRSLDKYLNMPIAIYSTSNSDEDINETFALGANIFITKPTDYENLKKILLKVLYIRWQYHSLNFSINTFVVAL